MDKQQEHSRRKRRNHNLTKLSKYFVSPNVVNRLGLLPPLIPAEQQISAPVPSVSLNAVMEALTITETSPTAADVKGSHNDVDDDHTTVKTFKSDSMKSAGSVSSFVRASRGKSDQLLYKHSHSQEEDDMSLNSMFSMKSSGSSQSRSSVLPLYPNIRVIHGKLKARAIIAQRLPPTKPMVVFPRELLEAGDNNINNYSTTTNNNNNNSNSNNSSNNNSRRGDQEVPPPQQLSSKSMRKVPSVTETSDLTSATTELLPNNRSITNNNNTTSNNNSNNNSRRGDQDVPPPPQQFSPKTMRKVPSVTETSDLTSATTELLPHGRGTTNDSSNRSSNDNAQKEATIDISEIGVEGETQMEKKRGKKGSSFDGSTSFGYKNQSSSGSRLFAPTAAAARKMANKDLDKSDHDEEHVRNEYLKKDAVASLEVSSRLLASIGKVKQVVEEEVYVPKKRKVSSDGYVFNLSYLVTTSISISHTLRSLTRQPFTNFYHPPYQHYRYFPPKVRIQKTQPSTSSQNETESSIVVEEEEDDEDDMWSTPTGQPWCPFCTMIFRNRLALEKHKFSRQHEVATGAHVEPAKEPEKIEVYEEGDYMN